LVEGRTGERNWGHIAESSEDQQRLEEQTLKLSKSHEGLTIKPFISPIEVKTINCLLTIAEYEAAIREEEREDKEREEIKKHNKKVKAEKEARRKAAYRPLRFIFDSGCTQHIVSSIHECDLDYRKKIIKVTTAGGGVQTTIGEGKTTKLGHVLVMPSLKENMISTAQDDHAGHYTVFGGKKVVVCSEAPTLKGRIVRSGVLQRNTYYEQDHHDFSNYEDDDEDDEVDQREGIRQVGDGKYSIVTQRLLHCMIGPHGGIGRMNKTLSMADGLPSTRFKKLAFLCPGCVKGKMKKPAVPAKEVRRSPPVSMPKKEEEGLVMICFDIFEASRFVPSWQGNRYTIFFKDRESEMEWVFHSDGKKGFREKALKRLIVAVEAEGKMIDAFKSDAEHLYWPPENKKIARRHNKKITFEESPNERKEFNGFAESGIGSTVANARCLMADAPQLGASCWESALNAAVEFHNCSATSSNDVATPLERWCGRRPDFTHKMPFGTPVYFKIPERIRRKKDPVRFQEVAEEVFVLREDPGNNDGARRAGPPGYECVKVFQGKGKSKKTHKVFTTYDVQIHPISKRRQPPLMQRITEELKKRLEGKEAPVKSTEEDLDPVAEFEEKLHCDPEEEAPAAVTAIESSKPLFDPLISHIVRSREESAISQEVHADLPCEEIIHLGRRSSENMVGEVISAEDPSDEGLAVIASATSYRVMRVQVDRQSPLTSVSGDFMEESEDKINLQDILPTTQASWSEEDEFGSEAQLKTILYQELRARQNALSLAFGGDIESARVLQEEKEVVDDLPATPTDERDALSGPWREEWLKGMAKERDGIEASGTFGPKFKGHKGSSVKSKWAFRVSREANGEVKFRSRIVGKGYSQIAGIDYFSTFAPTIAVKTLLMVLHIAAHEGMQIRNLDISNAYLESPIDANIYMELPRTEWDADGQACFVKLLKSIYGLKQSGELWNKRLNKILIDAGFTRSFSDPCLYFKYYEGFGKTFVCVYVDDILYAATSRLLADVFEDVIRRGVRKVSLLGDAKKFLGMEITRDLEKNTITLKQTDYIKEMAATENATASKFPSTPAASTVHLLEIPPGDLPPMRSIVGKLRYPADRCHPGILFIMSMLGSTQLHPSEDHLKAANRVLEYLKGVGEEGITLGGLGPISLTCFVDAGHSGVSSQLGIALRLHPDAGLYLSRSIKDHHVSFSSSEAELRGFVMGVFEVLWSRFILEEIGYPQIGPTPIYEDNSAVVTLMETLASPSGRTKHINKLRMTVQQYIDSGEVTCVKVPGTKNVADLFTKPLDPAKYKELNHDATGGRLLE